MRSTEGGIFFSECLTTNQRHFYRTNELGVHWNGILWSISSTFSVRIFRAEVLSYFPQSHNVIREKLPKRLLYEKDVRKMLMKLTPGHI